MQQAERAALLLLNLGTPASPAPSDVRRYLREFLSDGRVLDIPALQRWLVLNLFILPRRPRQSGLAYEKIWTDRGSPLLTHTQDLTVEVQKRIGPTVHVELAMRYGEPSIEGTLRKLSERGVTRIVVFPLYPQYSSATTGSTVEAIFKRAAREWNVPYLQIVPPFYDHPLFLDAFAAVARPVLDDVDPERVFFSFHGLPERQILKSDPGGAHCLKRDDCCQTLGAANRYCYRAHCVATARGLAERLGVPEDAQRICFQSRLGRVPWIRPYTDEILATEARAGCKRAVIFSPAFVADCLETLEELAIRGQEIWQENGGETLQLIPSLNATGAWADAVVTIARETSAWLGGQADPPGSDRPTVSSAAPARD